MMQPGRPSTRWPACSNWAIRVDPPSRRPRNPATRVASISPAHSRGLRRAPGAHGRASSSYLPVRGEHRFNFSFSGLKTAVLNLLRQLEQDEAAPRPAQTAADIAAAFQAASGGCPGGQNSGRRHRVRRQAGLHLRRGRRQSPPAPDRRTAIRADGPAAALSAPLSLHRQRRNDRRRGLPPPRAKPGPCACNCEQRPCP